MDMSKYAGSESKYLKAADIKGRKVRLKIREVSLVEFEDDGKKKTKPVIFFHGKEKGMVLNGTSVEKLGHELGYDSGNWIDTEIEVTTTYYPNLNTDGLVLEVYKEVDFDDDVPF